jgi:hypothetical protein
LFFRFLRQLYAKPEVKVVMNSSQLFGTSGFTTDLPRHGKAMPLGSGGHQADRKPAVKLSPMEASMEGRFR